MIWKVSSTTLLLLRILAIFVGCFLLISSLLDIFGVIPYSMAMPTMTKRLVKSVPTITASIFLLLPYRKIQSIIARIIVGSALMFTFIYIMYISISGISGFLLMNKSWHIVPISMIMLGIVGGNLYAFIQLAGNRKDQSQSKVQA